jgi:hypothetical protein
LTTRGIHLKKQITKKIIINFTLSSSEAIMFNRGSKFRESIDLTHIYDDLSDCQIDISFQIERSEQDQFNFIADETNKHRESQNEN